MPVAEYAEFSKKDPLTTQHLKVPKSVITIFGRESRDQQRHITFLMRQVLVVAAQKLAIKHEDADKRNKLQVAAARKRAS
jgi:hypothetical protein